MTSTGTCELNLMPEIIFSKKELQIRDFESFIFWFTFHFMGTALGRFSQSFFFFFKFSSSVKRDG